MKRALCLLLAAAGLSACSTGSYDQAVAVLIDTSGTYADQKDEVARIVKREVLPTLVPGDTIALVRIDSESYQKENLEMLVTLDRRPSHANSQKLGLAQKLDNFAEGASKAKFTDIRGAMMLAGDYLREANARSRIMIVFSDMLEELPPGSKRNFGLRELDGIEVIAMNVTQLQHDSADPESFRKRIETWQKDVSKAHAAGWRTMMDPAKLGPYLAAVR